MRAAVPLLDAALASALTMLAFATIVTVVVQIVQDLFRMKARRRLRKEARVRP